MIRGDLGEPCCFICARMNRCDKIAPLLELNEQVCSDFKKCTPDIPKGVHTQFEGEYC